MAVPLSYNLRNLKVRYTTTIMTALGIGLTVAVLLGILALVSGLRTSLEVTGNPTQVLALRQGATSELVSVVTQEQFNTIKFLDGVQQLDGEPMVSHEVVSIVSLRLRGTTEDEGNMGNVNIRGLSPMGLRMRDGLELVEGRWFESGKREVVVGQGVHGIRGNTDIGDKIPFGRGEWEVVGIFNAGRSAYNSEIWTAGNLATTDLGRGATRSSAIIRATDEAAAMAIANRIKEDQRLLLEGRLEREYYEQQMSSAAPIQGLGIFVAVIMAVGSCFAGMNTMYTAVARRAREVGTLRLLGFSRWSIAAGLIFAAVMGMIGGLLPARLAAGKTILNSLRGS